MNTKDGQLVTKGYLPKLIDVILENRSLVENDPLNISKNLIVAAFIKEHGTDKFIRLCHTILDKNE